MTLIHKELLSDWPTGYKRPFKKRYKVNLFPSNKILTLPILKEFADDNFKFDENGRVCYKRVENTEEKGEIACYEQFLLFLSVFKRLVCIETCINKGLLGKGLSCINKTCVGKVLQTMREKRAVIAFSK